MAGGDVLFDELDPRVVALLVEHVNKHVEEVFPGGLDALPKSRFHHSTANNLNLDIFGKLLDMIDDNLAEFYEAEQGSNWRDEKTDEMHDKGLCYVWYTDSAGNLVGFVSFSVVNEADFGTNKTVLYLYEIHIAKLYQSTGIGSVLLDAFHRFGAHLKQLHNKAPTELNAILSEVYSTNLTVFANNKRAVEWYFKKGYSYTADSPIPRLRSGRTPLYYLLYRPI